MTDRYIAHVASLACYSGCVTRSGVPLSLTLAPTRGITARRSCALEDSSRLKDHIETLGILRFPFPKNVVRPGFASGGLGFFLLGRFLLFGGRG